MKNSFQINSKIVSSPENAYKYIKREDIISELVALRSKCVQLGIDIVDFPADNLENLSKRALIDYYGKYAEAYNDVAPVESEVVEEEPAIETVSEEEQKVSDEKPVKKESKGQRGTAQERFEKYTKELAEKEAIANPDRDVKHRIASLKRKIARAQKVLA